MTVRIDRRTLIRTGGLGLGVLSLTGGSAALAQLSAARGFTHGVASGEPAADSVLLWTRHVPGGGDISTVRAELSDTPDFTRIVGGGEMRTAAFRDWTVKITVDGLNPGTRYYYRFIAPDGGMSPVGRTKTLPQGPVSQFRIAAFSCANMPYGFFNAYGHAAARDDIDLVVHLGDYYYEYARGTYPTLPEAVAGRTLPTTEAIHLADYRLRLASYRADPDLQRLHQLQPMIALWDDHEVGNDSWEGGAENHQPDEGDYGARKAAALQAYREWMPVSDAPWQAYDIGDLARFMRTETRLTARTQQPDIAPLFRQADPIAALKAFRDGAWMDPAATMMGSAQESWLAHQLKQSVAQRQCWQVVGNGTVMGKTVMPAAAQDWVAGSSLEIAKNYVAAGLAAAKVGLPFNFDAWGGYPAARSRFLKSAQAADANLVVLCGDSHNGWAYDLAEDGRPAGVECAGHSVTSPGYEQATAGIDPATIARGLVEANAEMKWADTSHRGYMTLELTPTRATGEWVLLETVRARSLRTAGIHRMSVQPGRRMFDVV